MSLPNYSNRADSGDPLIGTVPAHWNRSALKRLATYQNGYAFKPEDWTDDGKPIIRIAQLTSDAEPNYFGGELDERLHVSAGDLLFSWSATIDSFIWRSGNAWLNQHIFKVSPTEEATKSYLFYLIKFLAPKLADLDAHGSTMRHIKKESLGQLVYVPPIEEQRDISAFLDRETAKIDALIAEQEKLIALLAEKRQATISHAVTKGLNPNAPMKDSGVAWLGNVPAHWTVQSIKHLVSTPITDGPHETPNFPDEGIPFVSAEAVSGGFIDFEKIRGYISAEDHLRYGTKYKPQLHDIYMVKSGATTGVTAIVETETDFNIWSPLAAIRCDRQKAEPYFVLAALRSRNFQEGVALNWSFGTQQNIGMRVLGDLPIALPPLAEQREIAAFLALETPKLNTLGSEATRAIALLKERRSALIAAAVTGQIDVRDAVLDEVEHGRR